MKITKENINKFRNDFSRAVSRVEKKYGVTIGMKGIHPDNESFHTKIDVRNIDAKPPIEADYLRFQESKGLPKLGTPIVVNKEKVKVTGFVPRGWKFPVLVTTADGNIRRISLDTLKSALKAPKKTITRKKGAQKVKEITA